MNTTQIADVHPGKSLSDAEAVEAIHRFPAHAYAILATWEICELGVADEKAIEILEAIRRSAPRDASVPIIEAELPTGPEPHPAKALNFMMLSGSTGRERTASEYETLLTAAGFEVRRVIPASSDVSLFEATPSGA
jgi:hypothetical protein